MSQVQPRLEYEILRLLKTYYDIQKLRLAVNNRVAVSKFTLCPANHMVPLAEADLLPALKGEGSLRGGSSAPLIYLGLHLSSEGHSGGSELPTSGLKLSSRCLEPLRYLYRLRNHM